MSVSHFKARRLAPPMARLAMLLLACGWLLGPAPAALADAITVDTTSDTADPLHCRLRDAILAANNNIPVNHCPAGAPGRDTITFNWGHICQVILCQLTLTSALPKVLEDVTIDGLGLVPTISGENLYGIFDFGALRFKGTPQQSDFLADLRLILNEMNTFMAQRRANWRIGRLPDGRRSSPATCQALSV